MAKAKSNGQALTKYDERLAALAKHATEVEANVGGGGNWLSIRGGILSYQGVNAQDNMMSTIIIRAMLENQYYDKPYNPNSPAAPACYAFGESQKDMAPHEAVTNPISSTCASCDFMKFNSAPTGKGKACKACQRLALITEGDLADLNEDAEIALLKLPFYSTIEYSNYVHQLAEQFKKPPLAFVTQIKVVNDAKAQFKVLFKLTDKIEDPKALELLLKLYDKAQPLLLQPYPENEGEEAPAAPQRKAATRQAAPAARKPVQRRAAAAEAPAAAAVAAGAAGTPVKVGLRRGVKPKY